MMENNGGYYAIKGFEFQIDKAILEILQASENTPINIEQIQDVDSGDFVMQIKYKETQTFTLSKIKEPVTQLIDEFKKDNSKKYILYAHFGDLNGYNDFVDSDNKITKENLIKILGSKNPFADTDVNSFVNKFYLDLAPTFQEQFKQVIEQLKKLRFISDSDDEAIFYYANIADYLRKLVVNSKSTDARSCTKKQILDYIENGKKLVFNSVFKEYKGEQAYYKVIKSKFVKAKRNQENFIFIGNIEVENSVSIDGLVTNIVNKYYKGATCDIKPLTFIIPDDATQQVKKRLIADSIHFNDGYEHIQFSENAFFREPIINRKPAGNKKATDILDGISFKLRLLSLSKFNQITEHGMEPSMVYYFDFDIPNNIKSSSWLKIDQLNTKQIDDLFAFQ